MNETGKNLIKIIHTILNESTNNLRFDKTFKSTIWGKNDDGTYQISHMNQTYNVYNALNVDLSVGQSVWVKIPSGVFKDMHICGINHKKRIR